MTEWEEFRMIRVAGLAVLASLAMPTMVFAACDLGMAAPTIPDGTKASQDEMVAASQQVKSFNAAVVAYQTCLDKERDEAVAAKTETPDTKKARDAKFNEAGEAVQKAGEAFNLQVRAFKAKG
jgi:Skp family chaperone for outer membrane proteins